MRLPVGDDGRLFEKLSLEGFQSGLSRRTILAKREAFRTAFHGFDFDKVASFTARDVEQLLKNDGIVRHRGKIEAVINNARQARELVKRDGSLAAFIWRYEPSAEELAHPQTASSSAASTVLSKELKKQGWKSAGPTAVYAFKQAMEVKQWNERSVGARSIAPREKPNKLAGAMLRAASATRIL